MASNFLNDSAVTPIPGQAGRYAAELSPEWAVWGPNGGFVAAVALRAAMEASRFERPASFQCHFLAVGTFGPVEARVESLGGGRRAESLRVELRQGERLLLAATAWFVDDGLSGFEHDVGEMPEVAGPEALKSYEDLAEDYADWYSIWRSIEARPLRFREAPGDPVWHAWARFQNTPIAGIQADALRLLFWIDLPGWNAVTSAHAWPFEYLAPNLDLTIQFHRFAPEEQWTLCDGYVPVASEGLLGSVNRLWAKDGRLLATGTSKHVCRPNPGYREEVERARQEGLLPE